jgi:signal transduction histidine kinase
MTPFGFSGLLAGITSLGFGLFVFLKSRDRGIAKVWLAFALSVAGWGFGAMWIGMAKTPHTATLAWIMGYAFGVIWIAALFYHFICVFLGLDRPKSILFHYVIATLFLASYPSNLFFKQMDYVWSSIFFMRSGVLHYIFFCWWASLVVYSQYLLLRAYPAASPIKKAQIKYFFLAMVLGFSGGSMCYLPNFGFDLYPWGNFTVFLYPIIMSYAILKHRLMDINIVIKKTLLYSFVTAGLASVYAGLITLVAYLIGNNDQIPFISTTTIALHGITCHWLLAQIRMSFSYASLVTAISSITLGLFVYLRGKRKPVNIIWFFTCLAISWWSFGLGMVVRSKTFSEAYFWNRWFTHIGAILIPIHFLHFVTALVGVNSTGILLIGYAVAFILCMLTITGHLISVVPTPPFQYYALPLPLYSIFLVYFFLLVLYSHVLLAYKVYVTKDKIRKQLAAILIGTGIGFIGGSTTFLPAFHIHIFPYGAYVVPIYVLAISYAIFKHQLMDISVVIRKTLLYSLVSAALIAVYVGTITLLAQVLGTRHASSSAFSFALAAVFITLLFNPLRVRIQRFVDRHFSREAVDKTVLREITSAFVHEIKTPLSNIALPAELTFMDMDDLQGGKKTPDEVIPKIKKRMKYIMDQALLAGSKVEAVREATVAEDIARSSANLDEVFNNSIKQMNEHLRKAKVETSVEAPEIIAPVRASARQLEVVFGNLIKNAAEAMAGTRGPRRLEISAMQVDGKAIVTVADTGPGIKPADLQLVFDPHYTTKGPKGAGTGLALCRQIIEAHKGTIEVSSTPGHGATFTIILPTT